LPRFLLCPAFELGLVETEVTTDTSEGQVDAGPAGRGREGDEANQLALVDAEVVGGLVRSQVELRVGERGRAGCQVQRGESSVDFGECLVDLLHFPHRGVAVQVSVHVALQLLDASDEEGALPDELAEGVGSRHGGSSGSSVRRGPVTRSPLCLVLLDFHHRAIVALGTGEAAGLSPSRAHE
jgi:hypothetical protein